MIRKIISYLMTAVLLFTVGCATNSDIDDLQNQLENLEGRLEQSEAALQASLLDQIEDLQAVINSLQASAAQQTDLDAQIAELEALAAIVTENANSIYYGNVISPEQFDAVMAQGATVVTGDVIVTTEYADKLADVKLIGGNLEVNSEATLAGLEVVVGEIVVNDMATISGLMTAGGLELNANLEAPELSTVTGDIISNRQEMVTKFMAPKLNFANSINFEGEVMTNMFGQTTFLMTDFKVADGITVVEEFMLTNVLSKSALNVASASDFIISQGEYDGSITFTGETVGNFSVSGINTIVSIAAPNLMSAYSITISGNSEDFADTTKYPGLYSIDFDKVETIYGYLKILGNGMKEIDTFNELTRIDGGGDEGIPVSSVLEFRDGSVDATKIIALNKLVTLGNSSNTAGSANIRLKGATIDFLNEITSINTINQLHITSTSTVTILDKLETIKNLHMNFSDVTGSLTAFSAFIGFNYKPTLNIALPSNQSNIAGHIALHADVYKPFCDMIGSLVHELASDNSSVTSNFGYQRDGVSTVYGADSWAAGIFELDKSTSQQTPYERHYDGGWKYDETQANPYWTEAIAGITSSCQ